ncbi:MAG: tetratricopeptide repeat protein [Burkholderiales bacterium]
MSAQATPLSPEDSASLKDAVAHFEAGRLDDAERAALALLARLPANPDVRHLLALVALQRGRAEEALERVDGLLGDSPREAFALNTRGAACQALGRSEEAIAAYRAALDADPGYADAAGNLGMALLGARRMEEASALADEVLARMPQFLPMWMVGGHAALALGRLEAARARFAGALRLAPGHPGILSFLGDALFGLRRHAEALACFDEVAATQPRDAATLERRGRALLELGRAGDAEGAFRQATELAPSFAPAWHNLGCALLELGRFADCDQAESRAMALSPGFSEAAITRAAALNELARAPEAEAMLREVLGREPGNVRARINLCGALGVQKRHGEALEVIREAARLAPEDATVQGIAAGILAEDGRHGESVARYDEAIRLAPGEARWQVLRALALPVVPESADAIARARADLGRRVAQLAGSGLALPDPGRFIGVTGFYLAYHGEPDLELQRAIARMFLALDPALAWRAPGTTPRPRAGRRLRVAFLSAFLHDHTIGKLYRGFIQRLDRARFEVVVMHAMARADRVRATIDASADAVIALPARLEAARRAVAAAKPDILFYPDVGMHPFSYFLAFARLAPVQLTSWGHPDTTGLASIDHFLSGEPLEPAGSQAHYGERLVKLTRLPSCYARPRPVRALGTRERLGLPAGATLYACPQSLFKFHPAFDDTLGALLEADPRGHLALVASPRQGWNEALLGRFRRAFPGSVDRVRFLPFMPEAAFLDLLESADAVLDPVHFGGGNSTYEALGLGVPVVTLPGPFLRGRVTLACYRQMGFEDLVAGSTQEYVALAVRLANDEAFRRRMRERVRERSGALFDDALAVKELGAFLESAYDEALAREGAG